MDSCVLKRGVDLEAVVHLAFGVVAGIAGGVWGVKILDASRTHTALQAVRHGAFVGAFAVLAWLIVLVAVMVLSRQFSPQQMVRETVRIFLYPVWWVRQIIPYGVVPGWLLYVVARKRMT